MVCMDINMLANIKDIKLVNKIHFMVQNAPIHNTYVIQIIIK